MTDLNSPELKAQQDELRNKVCSTAEDRGMQMMVIPMSELPPLALEHAKQLCDQVGMCMEVLLTSWTVYAQCVEGLPCLDDLYRARPVDIEWYRVRLTGEPARLSR